MNTPNQTAEAKMVQTLPDKLALAVAKYYIKRANGTPHYTGETNYGNGNREVHYSKSKNWNKDQLLDEISAEMPEGWGYVAMAGTFFFRPAGGNYVLVVDDESWPMGEVQSSTNRRFFKS